MTPIELDFTRTTPAAEARDVALARVEQGAGETWMQIALAAVHEVALTHSNLISDDCRHECPDPPEPRAWGAVMRRASELGWIRRTDRTTSSTRVASHKRPMRVWESCLWGAK